MRLLLTMAAVAALAVPVSAGPADPILGEWQAPPVPAPLRSFRHVLFAPDAMILDRREAVAVTGYDLTDAALRVRTARGGDLWFVRDGEQLCLAEVAGLVALPSMPELRAGGRCFARAANPA